MPELLEAGNGMDNMKIIKVNNQRKIVLKNKPESVEVTAYNSDSHIDYIYDISDGDIVMLLNYYRNCKTGVESSDYISKQN